MKTLRYKHPFGFYYSSYFKATFFNQALPSTIGGDALRVLDVIKAGGRKKRAFFDVLIDRVSGLLGLLILSLFANIFQPGIFSEKVFYLLVGVSATGILAVAFLLSISKINFFRKYKFLKLFFDLSQRFRIILRNKKKFYTQISLSVLVHILAVISFFMIAISIRYEIDLSLFMAIVPAVLLITIIPVSLAGWGIRESAMIGLFLLVGAEKEKILSISILYGIILLLIGIYGAYHYIKNKEVY